MAASGTLWWTSRAYLPFFADDSLISLRYAARLLEGHGLTFTAGERVEGYSNLLWVLAVAAGGLVHADLIAVARTLGLALTMLTVAAVVWAGADGRPAWGSVAATGALALSHGLAVWAIGGLEQPLQLALLAWGLVLAARAGEGRSRRITFGAGACFALLALTRPDGLLFAGTTVAALATASGISGATASRFAPIAILPAAAWAAQLAFRLAYYGEWWPNTAYVKLSPSSTHAADGWRYLRDGADAYGPLLLLAVGIVLARRSWRRAECLVPLVAALGWAIYVVTIGGDIFPARRHFLPVVVCAAVAIACGWRTSLAARLPVLGQAALLVSMLVLQAGVQSADSANRVAREEVWEWECATMASELRTAFEAAGPLVAADPIGCVAYFSRLPALDLMGLNDRHIARTRPPDFGQGYIGHELGDGAYVLSRRPDLVILCSPGGSATGCFRSGRELVALPAFRQEYVLTTLAPAGARYPTLIWARLDSHALGVVRTRDALRLPGWFFASDGRTQAVLRGGRLVARIAPGGTARFDALPREAVGWRAYPQASAPVALAWDGPTLTATAGADGADLIDVALLRVGE
jgi:hypothetical protein